MKPKTWSLLVSGVAILALPLTLVLGDLLRSSFADDEDKTTTAAYPCPDPTCMACEMWRTNESRRLKASEATNAALSNSHPDGRRGHVRSPGLVRDRALP
jgi:hypothetical protein